MTVMLERPKTIDVPHGSAGFQELCRALLSLDVPDGYRAEIIGGNIVMSPWSRGGCMRVMRSIRAQLDPHAPQGHFVDHAPSLFTFPGQGRAYGPDVYGVASHVFDEGEDEFQFDGEALSLVVELTSPSTRNADWDDKLPVYGCAGVPVYLLADMQEKHTTVFWEPSRDGYTKRRTAPFGDKLPIPKPYDCVLDTTDFVRP
ncbi:Uma2 family endonuclease [Streptomyces sp. Ac-502]|uniref:Uma2 family endonuclease n=1 Tax=Streptomyces sp. Ac-502 TaxID=3342801 RepID=UPI003862B485